MAGAALLSVCVALAASAPAAAQQGAEGGGIVTEQLGPVTRTAPGVRGTASPGLPGAEAGTGAGEGDGATFKRAPFHTEGAPEYRALIPLPDTVPQAGARLRQLDKMTGRTETFDIAAGADLTVDRLRIRLDSCLSPADNAQHGTRAFLQVWDTKHPSPDPVFSGWMFAESPALSAMDHPRYDLWVISCTTDSGATAKGSE